MEFRCLEIKSCLFLLELLVFATTTSTMKVVDLGANVRSRDTDKGMAYAKFNVHKFSFLNMVNVGADYVLKASECGLACVNIPPYFSFNLAAFSDFDSKMLCELLQSDIYNNSKKFVASQSFHHYSIKSPCISWPCQNNGTCAVQYQENSYICVCSDGFTGKYCETDPLTVTICERKCKTISCNSGRTIDVLEAKYGRQNSYTCKNSGDRCSAGISYSVVYNRCQDQGSCVLPASNNVFGDPCKGTPKYLYVKYQCVP